MGDYRYGRGSLPRPSFPKPGATPERLPSDGDEIYRWVQSCVRPPRFFGAPRHCTFSESKVNEVTNIRISMLRTISESTRDVDDEKVNTDLGSGRGGLASDVPLNDTPEKGLLNPGDVPPSKPTAPVAAGASPGHVERSLFKVSRKSFRIRYLLKFL
jgi:hypothetical protein